MSLAVLNKIINNKTLGSSELTYLLNQYYYSIQKSKPDIIRALKIATDRLGHFEGINSYLKELNNIVTNKDQKALTRFLKSYLKKEKEKVDLIFERISPELKKMKSVISLSRSGTVLGILKLWIKKNKNLRVVICESRPKLEGRLMAESLSSAGTPTELITDAMMSIYVSKIDAAIVGADVILKNGNVVNKVGSKLLALLCKEHKKPFFVVSTKAKFASSNEFKPLQENPKEVYDKRQKNLTVSNIYFEEVEKNFITKIFTD